MLFLKKLLRSSLLEWKIKRSFIYEIYLRIFYPKYIATREKEVLFYRNIIGRKCDLIFDIGSSNGDKADRFLRLGSKVVCLEPDLSCYEFLHKRFLLEVKQKKLIIVNRAVSDTIGQTSFYLQEEGSPFNTLNPKWAEVIQNQRTQQVLINSKSGDSENIQKRSISTITLDNLIQTYGTPDFIKIDIEGHEIKALNGLNMNVPCLTFEVNLPDFLEEGIQCIDRLSHLFPNAIFNFFKDVELGLELKSNVNAAEIKQAIKSITSNSVEILCLCDRK